MLENAVDLGIAHAEKELRMQPRTFARRKPISQAIADTLDKYAKERAFWITGVVKEDVLEKARNYILWYTKMYPQHMIPGDIFTKKLEEIIKDYLPEGANTAARAALIARNNVSDLYNYARFEVFTAPAMQGWVAAFMYSAIMDSRTTNLCRSLNGRIFQKEDLQKAGLIPPNHHNSIVEGTMVKVAKHIGGSLRDVPIEKVKVGQLVLTHNMRLMPVTETMECGVWEDEYALTLENGETFIATPDHPVLTQRGWVTMDQLQAGDSLKKLAYHEKRICKQ